MVNGCQLSFRLQLSFEFSQLLALLLKEWKHDKKNQDGIKETNEHDLWDITERLYTLYNILHDLFALSCNKHHSMAMSYSILLGWEQCEVDTASFCTTKIILTNKWKMNQLFNQYFKNWPKIWTKKIDRVPFLDASASF